MLDRNNPKPLYQQLREILIDSMESGQWGMNEKIPSENELSLEYGVSRMTVRSVLTDLVREGWLYRVQGKGTFVAEKITALSTAYGGIREQLEKMGYEVETRIIESVIEPSSRTVAKNLEIEEGQPIYKIKRVRYVKGQPISIHVSHIPSIYGQAVTVDELKKEQLCVLLNQKYGLQRKKVVEVLESVRASDEEAQLLEVNNGDPLLLLKDIIYSETERPFEYTKVIFRGDKVQIKLQYE